MNTPFPTSLRALELGMSLSKSLMGEIVSDGTTPCKPANTEEINTVSRVVGIRQPEVGRQNIFSHRSKQETQMNRKERLTYSGTGTHDATAWTTIFAIGFFVSVPMPLL
jgi:hypothetical protein